jgi:hypothetical protein
MKTIQQTLPFSSAPLDFSEPIECKFHQLAAVRDSELSDGVINRCFRSKTNNLAVMQ